MKMGQKKVSFSRSDPPPHKKKKKKKKKKKNVLGSGGESG